MTDRVSLCQPSHTVLAESESVKLKIKIGFKLDAKLLAVVADKKIVF